MTFRRSGYLLGESRSAAVTVAPAPHGAGTHTDHEPVASSGTERRSRLQEELWREAGRKQREAFRLAPWASRRREDLRAEKCNPCLRNVLLPMSRNGHSHLPSLLFSCCVVEWAIRSLSGIEMAVGPKDAPFLWCRALPDLRKVSGSR